MDSGNFKHNRLKKIGIVAAIFVLAIVLFYYFWISAPRTFSQGTLVTIKKGETLSRAANILLDNGLIRSKFWFRNFVILLDGESGLQAGDYYFTEPVNVFFIAKRFTGGEHGLAPLRITIPEGLTKIETAEIFEDILPKFDKSAFIAGAKEGYLFPDTYFFLPNADSDDVLNLMMKTASDKLKEIEDQIDAFGESTDDVVKMVSILETEARTTETRRTIAGILWKRLSIGMPLQVDVTFKYINGKNTYELTGDDLDIDSPYNTYKFTGLPPTPIANPGLDSLLAAVTPKETDYLYFLSDKSGNMYYATTFEGHKQNRELYLNK